MGRWALESIQMKDELIINNKRYVHTPEVKEEKPARLEGWISPSTLISDSWATISGYETLTQGTRMIEILDSEIIVSEMDIVNAWGNLGSANLNEFLGYLGFKKDGV